MHTYVGEAVLRPQDLAHALGALGPDLIVAENDLAQSVIIPQALANVPEPFVPDVVLRQQTRVSCQTCRLSTAAEPVCSAVQIPVMHT